MLDATETSTNADARPQRRRQALTWALKILVSGGLLYLLFRRVDSAQLWQTTRDASIGWLFAALLLYGVIGALATWRWWMLVHAQHLRVHFRSLLSSFLVATFFNNFLPSNIGGDVIRIRDTARPAGSKTLATMIVLVDRGIGIIGLVFVSAFGATMAARMSATLGPVGPGILWATLVGMLTVGGAAVLMPRAVGAVLGPLRALHQEWVEERISRLTDALARFRNAPLTLVACFVGAIFVQGLLVVFYAGIARALHIPIPLAHLAIVVPLSSVVQMLPVSVNGFGIREGVFTTYFAWLGLPRESALALSLIGAVLVMIFSLTGAGAYLARGKGATA